MAFRRTTLGTDDISYFNQLPKELKELILLDLNLNIVDVLKIQSTSKEWRELTWRCLTDLDTNLLRDVELTDVGQRTTVIAKAMHRLKNPGVLRRLIMNASLFEYSDGAYQVYTEIYEIAHECKSLEYLEIGNLPPGWVLEYAYSLKNLSEISFAVHSPTELSKFDLPKLKCRANAKVQNTLGTELDNKETPISPKLNFSYDWAQKEPIKFHQTFHRGGMIGDELVVVGATDGTLTFFKREINTTTLTMHSSNNIHKGCINEIWNEQSQHTYVASSDGIVTAWDSSPEGPVLVQTIEFPEEILFVCDTAEATSKHILAASSHKLFIADLKTGKVIKIEQVDDSITGLFGNTQRVHVGTTKRFYASYGTDVTNGVVKRDNFTEALTPNFWVTPDASFRSVVLPHEVQCIDVASGDTFKRYPNPNSAKFDSRSGVLKFNPVRYWLTVSTSTNIVTYDLEGNVIISSVSPRISRSEINAGNFPTCHVLWWDIKGEVLFGLFSNNTLCWWHLPHVTKQRIEAQQEKHRQEEQQAKERLEEHQAPSPPSDTSTYNDK